MTTAHGSEDHGEFACNCGDVFDTLDELKAHVEEQHPDVYEEKFAG